MPYSHFNSLKSLKAQFSLEEDLQDLFGGATVVEPSDWLLQTIAMNTEDKVSFFSEKARSEGIVFPILRDVQRMYHNKVGLYSGANLEADTSSGLSGECDFVLSLGMQGFELNYPVFCTVEAKDNDLKKGLPQCAAQLLGARILNKSEKHPLPMLYGAVTTGEVWQFIRLEGTTLTIDTKRYYLAQLPQLLGVLHHIIRPLVNVTQS